VMPLSGASYMVGRHGGAGRIVVDHVTVSRKHALVVHEGEQTFVVDSSSNGTFVNGTAIPKREFVPLSQSDEVRFGDSPQVNPHPPPFPHAPLAPYIHILGDAFAQCSWKEAAAHTNMGASAVEQLQAFNVRVQP